MENSIFSPWQIPLWTLVAFFAAGFSSFLDFCYQEGNIFHFWKKWIERLPDWLGKPLGRCVYCHGVWIFVAFYFVLCPFDIASFLFGIGSQYVVLSFLYKYIL